MAKAGLLNFVLMIIILVICAFLILLTIPYWVIIHDIDSNHLHSSGLNIASYVISAVVLMIIAVFGIIGAIKRSETLLLCFGTANVIMWIASFIQTCLYFVTFKDCQDDDGKYPGALKPYNSVCDPRLEDNWLWVPSIILLWVNICAFVSAYLLCIRTKRAKESGEGGEGSYYG